MTPDKIASALAGGTWDALEGAQARAREDLKKMSQRQQEEATIAAAALNTEAGERFVRWLLQATVLRGPGAEQLAAKSAEEYALWAARREGQNQIMFMILAALEQARKTNGERT